MKTKMKSSLEKFIFEMKGKKINELQFKFEEQKKKNEKWGKPQKHWSLQGPQNRKTDVSKREEKAEKNNSWKFPRFGEKYHLKSRCQQIPSWINTETLQHITVKLLTKKRIFWKLQEKQLITYKGTINR